MDLDDGRIYERRVGPGRYLGSVRANGRAGEHRALACDRSVGYVRSLTALAQGEAAFLPVLMRPAAEEVSRGRDEGLSPASAA